MGHHHKRIGPANQPSLTVGEWASTPSWQRPSQVYCRVHVCVANNVERITEQNSLLPPSSACLSSLNCSPPASEPSLLNVRQLSDRVVCHNVIGILCQSDAWGTQVWESSEQQPVPLFVDKLPWRAAVKDKGKFTIKPDLHPRLLCRQLKWHLIFLLWELNVAKSFLKGLCFYPQAEFGHQPLNNYIYSAVYFFP